MFVVLLKDGGWVGLIDVGVDLVYFVLKFLVLYCWGCV